MMALADITAGLSLGYVQLKFSIKQSVFIMITGAGIASIIFHFVVERSEQGLQSGSAAIPVLVFIIRLFVKGAFGMGYFCNVNLFPALLRSKVFGVTNVVSRTITMSAPMAVEYLTYVSMLIIGASAIC
jgi:hypothetical protein